MLGLGRDFRERGRREEKGEGGASPRTEVTRLDGLSIIGGDWLSRGAHLGQQNIRSNTKIL